MDCWKGKVMTNKTSIVNDLRRQGWPDDLIAAAKVDGKLLSEIKDKPSKFEKMNKTESRYAMTLGDLMRDGIVIEYKFEAIKLKLAYKTFYTPDFFVRYADGRLKFVEIKGFLRDDAAVKFKLAREAFSWAEFTMLRLVKGNWAEVNI